MEYKIRQPFVGFSTDAATDFSSREVRARLSRSAMAAFFKIIKVWKVRNEAARQLLGGVSNGVYYQLKNGHKKTLGQDELTRISLLIGVFKALNVLYSDNLADAWITLSNSNPMFAGKAPLTSMIRGGMPAMIRVRQLLDTRRGGL